MDTTKFIGLYYCIKADADLYIRAWTQGLFQYTGFPMCVYILPKINLSSERSAYLTA